MIYFADVWVRFNSKVQGCFLAKKEGDNCIVKKFENRTTIAKLCNIIKFGKLQNITCQILYFIIIASNVTNKLVLKRRLFRIKITSIFDTYNF